MSKRRRNWCLGLVVAALLLAVLVLVRTEPAWLAQSLWWYGTIEPTTPTAVPLEGRRLDVDPGHDSYQHFDRWEIALSELVRTGDASQVYALLSYDRGASRAQIIVIRIGDVWRVLEITEREPDSYRCRTRPALREDVDDLQGTLLALNARDLRVLKRLYGEVRDGTQYEFLALDSGGGNRLFLNNPCADDRRDTAHCKVVQAFSVLTSEGSFAVRTMATGDVVSLLESIVERES